MELQEFIEATLIDIIQGIKNAQSKAANAGAIINPRYAGDANRKTFINKVEHSVYDVDFRIILTSYEGKENKKGIGVFLSPVGIGANAKSDIHSENTTNVSFSVPVIYPSIDDSEPKRQQLPIAVTTRL
jgi:hypothetical protein